VVGDGDEAALVGPAEVAVDLHAQGDGAEVVVTDQGGTVEVVDTWGKRRMSFSLKKNREGVFVHTRFSLDPGKVAEVRRAVNLIEEVLRSIITNAVGKTPEPKSAEAAPVPATPAPATTPTEPPTPPTPSAAGA